MIDIKNRNQNEFQLKKLKIYNILIFYLWHLRFLKIVLQLKNENISIFYKSFHTSDLLGANATNCLRSSGVRISSSISYRACFMSSTDKRKCPSKMAVGNAEKHAEKNYMLSSLLC